MYTPPDNPLADRSHHNEELELTPRNGSYLNGLAPPDEVRRPINTEDFRGTGCHSPARGRR